MRTLAPTRTLLTFSGAIALTLGAAPAAFAEGSEDSDTVEIQAEVVGDMLVDAVASVVDIGQIPQDFEVVADSDSQGDFEAARFDVSGPETDWELEITGLDDLEHEDGATTGQMTLEANGICFDNGGDVADNGCTGGEAGGATVGTSLTVSGEDVTETDEDGHALGQAGVGYTFETDGDQATGDYVGGEIELTATAVFGQ